LRDSGLFVPATDAEIAAIRAFRSREIRVPAGAALQREQDLAGDLYTLLSGWAFRYKTLKDDRRQILNFLLPGDFIGLQGQLGKEAQYGVETLTDAALCVFPRKELLAFFRDQPQLGYDITWLCAHEEMVVDDNLVTAGRRNAQERVAMLLLHLWKRAGRLGLTAPDGVAFPLTQQHIADALGLSLVHTNKTMARLRRLGMFSIEDGRLQVLAPRALASIADWYEQPIGQRPLI